MFLRAATIGIKNQELDPIQSTRIFLDDYELSDEQVQLFQKITLVSDYYFFDKNNKIQISLSGDQLMTEFGFSKQEVRFLHRNVLNKQVYSSNHDLADNNPITPLVHISGGALYISYDDLVADVAAGLVVAASAGPAAMAAALTSLGSIVGGPVGTVIGVILSLAAAPSLIELCGRILWAIATGRGIYIKPVWSYPPLELGYCR